MKIKYKYYNLDYQREFIGSNLIELSKLIIELLDKKDNIEKEKLYKIINKFYEITLEEEDYLEYINEKQNTQYNKIIEIPTNIVTVSMQSEGHGRDFSWWTENYQKIVTAATKDFQPDKNEYTLKEIENFIENKIIYPMFPNGKKTNKKAYHEKDNIKYLLNYKTEPMTENSEYFETMIKKEINTIGKKEFLEQIRVFIINLIINLEINDMYDMYFYDEYDEDEIDEQKSQEEYTYENLINLKNQLLETYNKNIKENQIKKTAVDIVVDYLKNYENIKFLFEDININLVVDTIASINYEENKTLCEEIQQIAIKLEDADLCYNLASCCDWINKQIMAEIVINDGNPEINYYFASEVEGADIERHKQVILNNEYTEEYILERTKKL